MSRPAFKERTHDELWTLFMDMKERLWMMETLLAPHQMLFDAAFSAKQSNEMLVEYYASLCTVLHGYSHELYHKIDGVL